jgi:hypothetical protein
MEKTFLERHWENKKKMNIFKDNSITISIPQWRLVGNTDNLICETCKCLPIDTVQCTMCGKLSCKFHFFDSFITNHLKT